MGTKINSQNCAAGVTYTVQVQDIMMLCDNMLFVVTPHDGARRHYVSISSSLQHCVLLQIEKNNGSSAAQTRVAAGKHQPHGQLEF